MATDLLSTPSTATVAGLLAAGLGAVYAYTQLGPLLGVSKDKDTHSHTRADARNEGEVTRAASTSGTTRKGKKKKKGKGVGGCGDEGEGEGGHDKGKDKDKDTGDVRGGTAAVVPGDFEAVGASTKVDAGGGSQDTSPGGKPGNSGKTKRRRRKKNQGKAHDRDEDRGNEDAEEEEDGSETGKEGGVGHPATHGPTRSGDSTDADASPSLSPSVSASTPAFSRTVGKGNLRVGTRLASSSQPHVQARAHAPSQPRAIRPSLSFDTDSSWTRVDHHHLKTFKSVDGQTRKLADAMDVTSSDLASTESSSPVAEYTESVNSGIRNIRADLAQCTLAEKLVPRPEETGVDDMLEHPDFPTLARVMRVQPPADETPVPGFSWEDYGNVVEDSLLVHDADQEDEGEWGIVKSRNRTRPLQAATAVSTSHAAAAPATTTKKQRQNARKRELAKAVKTEAEAARLEGLVKHKRELERIRIIEHSQHGGGKRPSGGMQATVDDRGKLVWE